ncbi:LysE family translocator [Sinorhizobium mexicanum]|uniref:LysE family translocator n=1 Tax=Sinorhizobium mexicanum TaxID=375549 RepID=A0A859QC81_9HYPH|nr:LysE family transporter [Sinorhizobium mexicanum]MBP1881856.1 threonine/homoserine/homoserine lactone efflux protein [Sinorhizobium mexicanum]QLL61603.1 LysE family translocator [Sinorhizobium mexicanum]
MSYVAIYISILSALLAAAISPGPSFLTVSRISASHSRSDGLAAAAAMGLGGCLFSVLALAGLTSLLSRFQWLDVVLKLLGGGYLVYIGIQSWRHASSPLPRTTATSGGKSIWRSFRSAFLVQVSNPKTIVVYASVFASLLPAETPTEFIATIPIGVFMIETGWYALVALGFSSHHVQGAYDSAKRLIDRSVGILIAGLGVRLIGLAHH